LKQATEPSSPNSPAELDVCGALGELIGFCEILGLDRTLRDLLAARERVALDRVNLVVLGEFKRGKSTLINALLDRELLPTGVLPLTSTVTAVAAGEPKLLVWLTDGETLEAPVSELGRYVTEAGNPGNHLGVARVRVQIEHELLEAGIDLVDTPGVGSIYEHNTNAAHDFLGQVDAAVLVLDAGQPFTAAEQQLVRELADRTPRVLVVLNKIDQLTEGDRRATLEFIEQAANELLGSERDDVFPVSAREGEGTAALRRRLRGLATDERSGTLARSVAGIAAAAAAELLTAARLEISARELPLSELERRLGVFTARIGELRSTGEEASELLEQGVRAALSEHLDRPLEAWARTEADRLRGELGAYAAERRSLSSADLSRALSAWIDERIRVEFASLGDEYEPALAGALAELQERYAQRLQSILDEARALAAEVFDTERGELWPPAGLRERSRFSFKLDEPQGALEMIVGRARTLVPGRVGHRMLLRDAEERLVAMADRHAGRLRSQLHEQVVSTSRAYRKELAASVEQAIGGMTGALARASSRHAEERDDARARLGELAGIVERCELICKLGRAS